MRKKKYELTDEHRAQLKPWADKWIANAMSTKSIKGDWPKIVEAVRGLYAAANLHPPRNIVYAPSPICGVFASGFARAIIDRPKPAVKAAATAAATQDATEAATWAATRDATRAATRAATEAATWAATRDATRAATRAATEAATEAAIWDETWGATRDATWAATAAATQDATEAATADATAVATEVATRHATEAASWAATRAATLAATWAATRAATRVATEAATRAATEAATRAATEAAIWDETWGATVIPNGLKWYVMPDFIELSKRIGAGKRGLNRAQNALDNWNGGNHWSAYVAFLSFFRHVAKLDLDYSKWSHYETLAELSGPRIMYRDFCIVCDRPEVLLVDDRNRPHCDTGPFCKWRDKTALYAVHGVRVPAWLIEHPERLTAEIIDQEPNAEVRRVMVDRYGVEKYMATARVVHEDDYGTLLWKDQPGDEPIVMVKVVNSTPEPDGSFKDYFISVHPELRPLLKDGKLGEPQELTARNAVASTFGKRGPDYAPCVET